MTGAPLEIDLLRTFVSAADSGGFTRAGERVHRTQSTVSQQIQRLELAAGHALFHREGRKVRLTEEGDLLLGYARRLLDLHDEAKAVLGQGLGAGALRLGVTEDFASRQLADVLSRFAAAPRRRLEVRCDLSVTLRRDLARGDIDLALVKQPSGQPGTLHRWDDQLHWLAAEGWRPDPDKPLPLVLFSPGCLYRQYALEALDRERLPWHVAYVSPSLAGVQAALQSGLGVSALGRSALAAGLSEVRDLPALPVAELALVMGETRPPGLDHLIDAIVGTIDPVMAAA